MNPIRSLVLAIALVLSAVATVVHTDSAGTIHQVAGYVTAALAAAIVALRGPTAARKARHHVIKHVTRHRQKKAARKQRRAHPPKHPIVTPPAEKFPAFGLDWAWGALDARQLRDLGVQFACRYLSTDPSKNLTPEESRQLHDAGIKRVVVWETLALRATQGQVAGEADARAALQQARACGLPDTGDWAIFFAVDFDAQGPEVAEYFRGVRLVLNNHVGVYAGYNAVDYLYNARLIDYAWQTYAWSGGRWHPNAHLLQYSNDHTFYGVGVDLDHALTANCGWW